jgi:hypothetical protein
LNLKLRHKVDQKWMIDLNEWCMRNDHFQRVNFKINDILDKISLLNLFLIELIDFIWQTWILWMKFEKLRIGHFN